MAKPETSAERMKAWCKRKENRNNEQKIQDIKLKNINRKRKTPS